MSLNEIAGEEESQEGNPESWLSDPSVNTFPICNLGVTGK